MSLREEWELNVKILTSRFLELKGVWRFRKAFEGQKFFSNQNKFDSRIELVQEDRVGRK